MAPAYIFSGPIICCFHGSHITSCLGLARDLYVSVVRRPVEWVRTCACGEEAKGEHGCARSLYDHHAASDVCWPTTAAMFRQPSILRNLICFVSTTRSRCNLATARAPVPR